LYVASGDRAEHRRRVQQAADERAAQRDDELESQVSTLKAPHERIGIWERLHALRLPRASGHVLVKVIARQTALTVSQVHEEQQRRAGPQSQSQHVPIAHERHTEDGAAMQQDQPAPAPAGSDS
jgi:hypothetical protein